MVKPAAAQDIGTYMLSLFRVQRGSPTLLLWVGGEGRENKVCQRRFDHL